MQTPWMSHRRPRLGIVALLLLAVPALAAVEQPAVADDGYRMLPGDLIEFSVFDHSDLTTRLGYGSTRWHLDAPNLEVAAAQWLVARKPAALCLDFPQDFVAREMPSRHVANAEFVTHHAVLGQGVPFIEDLRDLGAIRRRDPFLAAIPLRMTCVDGAPMRVFALEW